ncbi:MAG: hypothetical protein RIS92_707 [Verrucomicrobiota bacterium]
MRATPRTLSLLAASLSLPLHAAELPPDHAARMEKGLRLFREKVAPTLKEHCLDCHGGRKTKADLDIATRESLLKGGSEGPAVIPFDEKNSLMLKLVRHEVDPAMPDEKPKLPSATIELLEQWVASGAPYDQPLIAGKASARDRSTVTEDDRKWWAFQPLQPVAVPAQAIPPKQHAHPIDAFLQKARTAKSITAAPAANPRTLVRRLFLDVTGFPPSPEAVDAFLADTNPNKWEKLVDQQLASPAYGERWARHWLDVARFAESSGFEHDYDRPYAFHYRDFVIKALNADMPYPTFVKWQIAGDEIEPTNPQAMMATGFLGAGVFPTQITANEVERTRYDAMDDMLSTTASAFLGLTVGCARCHDHKFDPIPTEDYYRMLSTFTTTVRSNVDLVLDKDSHAKAIATHEEKIKSQKTRLQQVEKSLRAKDFSTWLAKSEPPQSALTSLAVREITSSGGATFRPQPDGSFVAEGTNPRVDTYTIRCAAPAGNLTGIRLDALADSSGKAKGPGRAPNGNFALSRIELEITQKGKSPLKPQFDSAEATHQQNTGGLSVQSALDDNPSTGWAVDNGGIGKDQSAIFVLREPQALSGEEEMVIRLHFAVNTGHNIARPRIGAFVGGAPSLHQKPVDGRIKSLLQAKQSRPLTPEEETTLFDAWKTDQQAWSKESAQLVALEKTTPKPGEPVLVCAEGFQPIVMHSQGAPFLKETHLLKRGDANQKVRVIDQGFLQILSRTGAAATKWQTPVPDGAKFSGRRTALANWITDTQSGAGALAARVIVNRIWQHHFGQGIVPTPNDFGKTGTAPAHPELLEWLANELLRNEGSLKSIHRIILTSAAYQQSSSPSQESRDKDPDNTLLTRYPVRRLEAEIVRDAALKVSGTLDPRPFGPGTLDEGSTRRSIYFTVKRSRLIPSMVAFDAPEPLTSQGNRPSTVVAPQALFQLNSPHARKWANALASRISQKAGPSAKPTDLITAAYQESLTRRPTDQEMEIANRFLTSTPDTLTQLADLCQNLLALNEFVYLP